MGKAKIDYDFCERQDGSNKKIDKTSNVYNYGELLQYYKFTLLMFTVLIISLFCFCLYLICVNKDFPEYDTNKYIDDLEPNTIEQIIKNKLKEEISHQNSEIEVFGDLKNVEDIEKRKKREIADTLTSCKQRMEHCKSLLQSMEKIMVIVNNSMPHIDALSKNLSASSSHKDTNLHKLMECLQCQRLGEEKQELGDPDTRKEKGKVQEVTPIEMHTFTEETKADTPTWKNERIVTTNGETGTKNGSTIFPVDHSITTDSNVTDAVEGQNVTGFDDTLRPSLHPSIDGQPEERSNAFLNANGYPSRVRWNPLNPNMDLQTKINDPTGIAPTAESASVTVQVEENRSLSWVPFQICFYGPPKSAQQHAGPGQTIFPASSSGPGYPYEISQLRGKPFAGPTNLSPVPGISNYIHSINAQSVQFVHGRQAQNSQGFGPTGPGRHNYQAFPTASEPTGPSKPVYCTYVNVPMFRYPGDSSSPNQPIVRFNPREYSEWETHYQRMPEYNARICPSNSYSCTNGERCIPKLKWCDGRVDCSDASDELSCTCKNRIANDRLCDGYFDCPHGEDELGCYGCSADSFNCGDPSKYYTMENCVPMSQRCDGVVQCPNGKDEIDCNILTDSYVEGITMFVVGYTSGYLHKNYKGQWYPACTATMSWAKDACMAEIGEQMQELPNIEVHAIPRNTYVGPYLADINGTVKFVPSCMNTTVYVKCPPVPCGSIPPSEDHYPYTNNPDVSYVTRANYQNNILGKLYEETEELLDGLTKNNNGTKDNMVSVVGGRASEPKAWPFLVAIYKNGEFHCGGAIVNEYWVLTAAHCLNRYSDNFYEVEAGMLRRFSFSPMGQMRKAKYAVIHPDYVPNYFLNDLGLMMLDQPLRFNRWIRPVCLPNLKTAGYDWKHGPPIGSSCIAIGWGAIREYGPNPDHLREVEVPILENCKYPSDENEAVICAGYPKGGHDACQGDSGGPLMCRNPNAKSQWYMAGIVSHGEGCAQPDNPGAYTKVSYFVDWIDEVSNTDTPQIGSSPLDRCPGFSCEEGVGKCLPIHKRCDRIIDCLDGEDEIGCHGQDNFNLQKQAVFDSEFVRADSPDNKTTNAAQAVNDIQENLVIDDTTTVPTVPSSSSTSSSNIFDYSSTQVTLNNTTVTPTEQTITTTTKQPIISTFVCEKMMQTIPISKRCDKIIDCEDGTDEDNCTCKDYLQVSQPSAICNGYLDCADKTDEKNCGICNETEFLCYKTKDCIPANKKCDGEFDCPFLEDELDCFALTNGEYIAIDEIGRPRLRIKGILARYNNTDKNWHPACHEPYRFSNRSTAVRIGQNMCKYFGFAGLYIVNSIRVKKDMLEIRNHSQNSSNQELLDSIMEPADRCMGLYIHCKSVLSSNVAMYDVSNLETGSQTYMWPWIAAIFVDGNYRCSALLLEPNWLLTNSKCIKNVTLSRNYVTALLGFPPTYLHVDGPHQQMSRVDDIKPITESQAALLHLKSSATMTRYVQPIFAEKKIYPAMENDLCVAVGTDENYVTKSVFLQPVLENCQICRRCFINSKFEKCSKNETMMEWSGTVFCLGSNGWYPTGVFQERGGPCSFDTVTSLTSIDFINAHLMQAMEEEYSPSPEPTCDGVRCNLGNCIPWNQVCNGVEDCRDGKDEDPKQCSEMREHCENEIDSECKCQKSEMRCGNGQCVLKSSFCDGTVDCTDGTDEPANCNCAEYLKLTAPEKLCDGVRNCFDKTDESPDTCECQTSSFRCKRTTAKERCIPQDFVCDNTNDCPEGEDEAECRKLKSSPMNQNGTGELIQRSYGVWHSACFPTPMTSQQEISKLCKMLGFENGTLQTNGTFESDPLVPSIDNFHAVKINQGIWVGLRNDGPLVTLIESQDTCYRLYINCR